MARLLSDRDGDTYARNVRLADDPADLQPVLNETRWQILTRCAERPRYPAELAAELDVHEQNVYYHVRQLEEAGFIRVAERREQGGGVAKYYETVDDGYALALPYGGEQLADVGVAAAPEALRSFLHPFVRNGAVAADIVVGSPDPHGPHQVRARDAHLAADLTMFLGQYGAYQGPRTRLDVDVTPGDDPDSMVLLGGPLTNMVTAEVNAHLPVRFDTEEFPFRSLVSDVTGTTYTDDTVGFIARTPHPDAPERAVMVLAGVRLAGTRAAVLGLTQYHDTVLDGYDGEEKWGAVVRGKDMDGDGTVDDIDILE